MLIVNVSLLPVIVLELYANAIACRNKVANVYYMAESLTPSTDRGNLKS